MRIPAIIWLPKLVVPNLSWDVLLDIHLWEHDSFSFQFSLVVNISSVENARSLRLNQVFASSLVILFWIPACRDVELPTYSFFGHSTWGCFINLNFLKFKLWASSCSWWGLWLSWVIVQERIFFIDIHNLRLLMCLLGQIPFHLYLQRYADIARLFELLPLKVVFHSLLMCVPNPIIPRKVLKPPFIFRLFEL